MLLGEGAYGKVSKIKVNQKYFALKETILPEYPKEPEVIMACLREEAMNLVHPHIIERKSSVFLNNTFQQKHDVLTQWIVVAIESAFDIAAENSDTLTQMQR